jgi:elongation factor G
MIRFTSRLHASTTAINSFKHSTNLINNNNNNNGTNASPLKFFSQSISTACNSLKSSTAKLFLLPCLGRSNTIRTMATAAHLDSAANRLRNIGISAHIDSGKTTLTERILYYTGRIKEIHEVKGRDNVGATMDHMELEREKGITITSAATHASWNHTSPHNIAIQTPETKDDPQHHHFAVNIIDTPGHVDFTIEVERSLRVLDGAIMVLCGVSGIQSQSLTVDRQMKRYSVPRVVFVNKLDRSGANPWKGVQGVRDMLKLNCAAVQIPIGLEADHRGVVDLIEQKAYYFEGEKGETIRTEDSVPPELKALVEEKRHELIEKVAEVDDGLAELFMNEVEPSVLQFKQAIRRATLAMKFVPVFMGSAYKNKGVQRLLDGVCDFLPSPAERQNFALDQSNEEAKVPLTSDSKKPFVGLAFKLEERPFGQLTYMRIYQGALRRGDTILDVVAKKKVKVSKLVKMHSNQMEDVQEAGSGEIVALFGVDCTSGTTFTGSDLKYTMTSMHVPEPVISLSIAPKGNSNNFNKALARFQKEDPTFRVDVAKESQEIIISGMGELHLEIYVERMKREYKVECITGQPRVNYREACTARAAFSYLHKKQSGGAGQYAKVVGYIEPLEVEEGKKATGKEKSDDQIYQFVDKCPGAYIPPEYKPAIQKGFKEALEKGQAGFPIEGVRVVLEDGGFHAVDSSELAFRIATQYAFRSAFANAGPVILEPVMAVEVEIPTQFQGNVVANLNRRKGLIQNVEVREGAEFLCLIQADVPLSAMFGYSTDLRSLTEGKGEFSMEYKHHIPVNRDVQEKLIADYRKKHQADAS